jgi:hypothetical protein
LKDLSESEILALTRQIEGPDSRVRHGFAEGLATQSRYDEQEMQADESLHGQALIEISDSPSTFHSSTSRTSSALLIDAPAWLLRLGNEEVPVAFPAAVFFAAI